MKNKLVELPDRDYGANHHIWDNNGTWWCHLSIARRTGPAKRLRFSLKTNNVREARKRRDLIMKANEAKAKALIKSWAKARCSGAGLFPGAGGLTGRLLWRN